MQRSLVKYRIGLAVIGWLTLLILVMVLSQAGAAKQDAKTQTAANNIADKLSSYIDNKQRLPPTLAAAGIQNVPPTISYTKKNNDIYVFCTTYKRSSSGFSAATVVQSLMSGGLDSGSGGQGYSGDSSSLFIDPTYHQGKNCQTINTGISTYSNTQNTQATRQPPFIKNSDNTYTVCGLDKAYFDTEGYITDKGSAASNSISITARYYPVAGAHIGTLFSPSSEVFDQNCNKLTENDLNVGDLVDLFGMPIGNAASASIYLKVSQ